MQVYAWRMTRPMTSFDLCIYCAVCCSVLQCVAVCCSVSTTHVPSLCSRTPIDLCIYCAVCCCVLRCVAVCCGVLRCVAVCCGVLRCLSLSGVLQYVVVSLSLSLGIYTSQDVDLTIYLYE